MATTPEQPMTFGFVVTYAPDNGELTTPVKAALLHHWGDSLASEIAAKSIPVLAGELDIVLPDPDYSVTKRFAVAVELHRVFETTQIAPPIPQTQTLKVTFDRPPAQMELSELLEALLANPARYPELRPYILGHHLVHAALTKTQQWVIVTDGRIDITRTLNYVLDLNPRHAVAQYDVDGIRLCPAARTP